MTAHRHFNGIGNHLTADERGFHPLMAHGNAIGDGDGVEATRQTTRLIHATTRDIGLMVERGVTRGGVIPGRDNADKGAGNLLFGQAHRIIIAAVRRALRPYGHMAAGKRRLIKVVRHGAASAVTEGKVSREWCSTIP